VPVNDKKESSKPALTPEEVKLKAQELRSVYNLVSLNQIFVLHGP